MSPLPIVVKPVKQFDKHLDSLRAKAKPGSQIAKNIKATEEHVEMLKEKDFKGWNDKKLERELAGYRSCYLDLDPNYTDKDGRHVPSHRLVYEQFQLDGKIYRCPIVCDTRDKVYKKALDFRKAQSGINFEQMLETQKDKPAFKIFLELPQNMQDYYIEKIETYDTLKANTIPDYVAKQHKEQMRLENRLRQEALNILNSDPPTETTPIDETNYDY